MPRGDVVGKARDGLQFGGFESGVGDAGLGGELRGIEEAAKRDGNLLLKHEADFAVEGMLGADPLFIGGRTNGEEGIAADGGGGEGGDEGEQRLPLEGGEVGVFDRRRNGIEERHDPFFILRRLFSAQEAAGVEGFGADSVAVGLGADSEADEVEWASEEEDLDSELDLESESDLASDVDAEIESAESFFDEEPDAALGA